jgi:putative Mg2+ transporter-C (MgtC) family protein
MSMDLATQLDLTLRLLLAASLGALIGIEREIHDHPAGMRTHLLVSVGSAAFTILSIYAFGDGDPGRVAAQIVSGIGFLGAGAILKEGASVRGLTTAASLWAVAAVGMAAGAGAWVPAIVTTFIVIVSLWPLRLLSARIIGRDTHRLRAEITLSDPALLPNVIDVVTGSGATIAHLGSRPSPRGGLVLDLDLRLSGPDTGTRLAGRLAGLEGVELQESVSEHD